MGDTRADEIIMTQSRYEANRGIFDSQFREAASLIWPSMNLFQQDRRSPGQKRTQNLYESTALLAKDRFATIMMGFAVPESDFWHTLTTSDDALNNSPAVSQYLDTVTRILFKLRYDPAAGFANMA